MKDETLSTGDETIRDIDDSSHTKSRDEVPDPATLMQYLESGEGWKQAEERARDDFAQDFEQRLMLEQFGRELQHRFRGAKVFIRGRRVEMSPPTWSVVVGSVTRVRSEADLRSATATALRRHGEADFLLIHQECFPDDDLPF